MPHKIVQSPEFPIVIYEDPGGVHKAAYTPLIVMGLLTAQAMRAQEHKDILTANELFAAVSMIEALIRWGKLAAASADEHGP